jgi:hypothetical protein
MSAVMCTFQGTVRYWQQCFQGVDQKEKPTKPNQTKIVGDGKIRVSRLACRQCLEKQYVSLRTFHDISRVDTELSLCADQ